MKTIELNKEAIVDNTMSSVEVKSIEGTRASSLGRNVSEYTWGVFTMAYRDVSARDHDFIKSYMRFVTHGEGANKKSKIEGTLTIPGKGTIRVSMVRGYANKSIYLSLDFSPAKLSVGSNVFHTSPRERIGGFSERASMMLKPFVEIDEWAYRVTGKNLLDTQDMKAITEGEVGVKNLTIASYLKMGKNEQERDELLAHLSRAVRHQVSIGGGQSSVMVSLPELIQGIDAESWAEDGVEEGVKMKGLPTGLLMKVVNGNNNVQCKALIYSKDVEVDMKGEIKNVMAAKKVPDLNEFVRVDATLSSEMLQGMMSSLFGFSGDLTVRALEEILSKPSLLLAISRAVVTRVRLPLLLRAPGLEDIEKAAAEDKEVADWMRDSRSLKGEFDNKKKSVRITWSCGLKEEVLTRIAEKWNLDLRVPFRFYLELNLVRVTGVMTSDDATRLTHSILKGRGEKELIDRVNRESQEFLRGVDSDLNRLPVLPPSRLGSRVIRPYLKSLL